MSKSALSWAMMATLCLVGCAGGADAPASASMLGTGGADMSMLGTGGTGVGTGGTGAAGMGAASGTPSFTRVWNEVLVAKSCSNPACHGAGTGMLRMDNSATAYASLVGVAASGPMCGTSGKMRVVAFDPDNSLLLDKISHDPPACGTVMPIGAKIDPMCISLDPTMCNTAAQLQLVHDWIANGAMND